MKEEIRRLRYCRSGRVPDRGGDGHGRVEERNQRGLEGVVQVGLARPDRADHVVVLVELVEPGAALVVDDMFVDILGSWRTSPRRWPRTAWRKCSTIRPASNACDR